MVSNELLTNTLSTLVLKIISENKRVFQSEILRIVKEHYPLVDVNEGSIARLVNKFEKLNLIVIEYIYVGTFKRKYLSITDKGKLAYKIQLEELEQYVEATINFLKLEAELETFKV